MLLTGVRQFQIDGLALRHHGLLRFATQLVRFALGVGLQRVGIVVSLRQHRFGLGVSLVENTLGVELGIVQQGFGLQLHRGTCRGSVFFGTVKQLGAGLFRAGEHLLRIGAQRCERIRVGLLVFLFLQLCLQFKDGLIVGLDLLTQTVHRLLSRSERLIDPFLVIPPQHDWELLNHGIPFTNSLSSRILPAPVRLEL